MPLGIWLELVITELRYIQEALESWVVWTVTSEHNWHVVFMAPIMEVMTDQWLTSTFILLQMHNYHHKRNETVPFSVKYKVPCNGCLVPWACARFLLDLEPSCSTCRLCCIINIIIHHKTNLDDKGFSSYLKQYYP